MRMTLATTLVMQAIGAGHRHGFDIVEITGYPTGTVYPALRRLERDGYVRSRWEAERTAAGGGRPACRSSKLPTSGVEALEAALDTLQQLDAARLRVKHAR
jgi:PadR family transcriptional regulator, regulatory protein PadR